MSVKGTMRCHEFLLNAWVPTKQGAIVGKHTYRKLRAQRNP